MYQLSFRCRNRSASPYLHNRQQLKQAAFWHDDNRAHAPARVRRVVVVRITIAVRIGKIRRGGHVGSKPNIVNCYFSNAADTDYSSASAMLL